MTVELFTGLIAAEGLFGAVAAFVVEVVLPAPPTFFILFLCAIIIAIILFPVCGAPPPSSGFCKAGETYSLTST